MALSDKKNLQEEITGDGQTDDLLQYDICSRLAEIDTCMYRDVYNYCALENCAWDELPNNTPDWWYNCEICNQTTSADPRGIRSYWCESCRSRIRQAEELPFTCRFCGKKQYSPSQWMFSRVCDDCIQHLYNKNCKKYDPTGLSVADGSAIPGTITTPEPTVPTVPSIPSTGGTLPGGGSASEIVSKSISELEDRYK